MSKREVSDNPAIVYIGLAVNQGGFVTSKVYRGNNFFDLIFAECKARLLSFAFGVFLYSKQLITIHCISPPFYQFVKKRIDRRKEKWQNAQKEENIRIILIH